VLVAGTGSACFGRNAKGNTWQAGGWGPILDDVGGGYWLGLRAIVAAVRAEDGRGPATELRNAVLGSTGAGSLREVLTQLQDGTLDRTKVAGLASHVIAAARKRDTSSLVVVALGAAELAVMAAAVAKQTDLASEPVEVVITGGVGTDPTYGPVIEAATRKRLKSATFPKPEMSAAAGAVVLAVVNGGGSDPSAALRRAGC
jgi:N-acetylglucosamine kinase-like BadF-type ATPase